MQQRIAGIPRHELPQKFCDAIDFARALGYSHIWIDSLCIIQDSDQDWEEQSSLVGDGYSNAYLNIAASALPDSSGSLIQNRFYHAANYRTGESVKMPLNSYTKWVRNKDFVKCSITIRYAMDHAHAYVYDKAEIGRYQEEPLLGRAWVFQERILSRRNVYITSSEVIWECRSGFSCECG